ncbi:MAG: hypothetical protein ABJF09_00475 [Qipengyuania citrea]|uniref:hypothetical protein n=1 Tax=Qipengyuania citrea TaxID=225971 RepID=UPI003267A173
MALPPSFRARVTTSAARMAERRIAPSGTARGLTVLGREGSAAVARREAAERQIEDSNARIEQREVQRDRMLQGLDIGARFSETQLEVAEKIAQLEREPSSGGQGHEQEVRRVLSEARTGFLGAIDDEELQARAAEQWASLETRTILRADTFEAAKRVEKRTGDFATMQQNGGALIYGDPTPETFAAQTDAQLTFIDAMEIGEDDKAQLKRDVQAGNFQSLLSGLIDTGQHAASEALRKDERFAGLLDYKTSQRFKSLAENAASVEARQAELAVSEAQDALREEIDGVRALIKAGATDVGAATLQQLQQRAQQLDLAPDELVELGDWQIALQVNRNYTSLRQLGTGIRGLENQLAEGKLNPAGQIQLRHMRDRRAAMLEERGEAYSDDWNKGGRARQGVVNQLFDLPVEDRVEAAAALDKSGTLGRALRLSKGTAGVAVAGAEARKADKDLLPNKEAARIERRAIFDEVTQGALDGYSVRAQSEVLGLAGDIYAGLMQQTGTREFDEDMYSQAVQLALGRRDGAGGVATWRGRGVLLPDWIGQREFAEKLQRFDFANAIEPAEVALRKYAPVLVSDDGAVSRWRFRDESGAWLGRKGGGIYESIIRRSER